MDDGPGRARSEQPQRRARHLRRQERRPGDLPRRPELHGLLSLFSRLKARLEPVLLSDTDFIDAAFREILGRDADQGGLEFYRGVLRQGSSRTAVLLDIVRSEEYRRNLTPITSALPNLVVQRPERYRRTIDRTNGQSILTFEAASPVDYDWLEAAIIRHGYYEKPGVWVLEIDFDKRLVAEMLSAFAPAAALE